MGESDGAALNAASTCVVCGAVIEPEPRYFNSDGKPRHMLCDEDGGSHAADSREAQCAYRRVGAKIHHRVPGCGTTWNKHIQGVWRGEVEVLTDEPADSRRCSRCYSDASYERHPL